MNVYAIRQNAVIPFVFTPVHLLRASTVAFLVFVLISVT